MEACFRDIGCELDSCLYELESFEGVMVIVVILIYMCVVLYGCVVRISGGK